MVFKCNTACENEGLDYMKNTLINTINKLR